MADWTDDAGGFRVSRITEMASACAFGLKRFLSASFQGRKRLFSPPAARADEFHAVWRLSISGSPELSYRSSFRAPGATG
jgi:hypothetical protein